MLTNDDGYSREGIIALDSVLTAYGHEVRIVAPSSNRSAQSHALNLREKMKIVNYKPERYHCSGTPADCVLYALKANIFSDLPDLIISGINYGCNCSSDIIYSGTCGAAAEGAIQGIPSIALSQEPDEAGAYTFAQVATWTAEHLTQLLALSATGCFINVNFPNPFKDKVTAATLGSMLYSDEYCVSLISGNETVYELKTPEAGRRMRSGLDDSDWHVISRGEIAISAVKVEPDLEKKSQSRIKELFK